MNNYQSLELTPEEVQRKQKEQKTLSEMRKKHQLNTTHETCPNCDNFPLEAEVFGYERSIFCTNCSYQRTEDM